MSRFIVLITLFFILQLPTKAEWVNLLPVDSRILDLQSQIDSKWHRIDDKNGKTSFINAKSIHFHSKNTLNKNEFSFEMKTETPKYTYEYEMVISLSDKKSKVLKTIKYEKLGNLELLKNLYAEKDDNNLAVQINSLNDAIYQYVYNCAYYNGYILGEKKYNIYKEKLGKNFIRAYKQQLKIYKKPITEIFTYPKKAYLYLILNKEGKILSYNILAVNNVDKTFETSIINTVHSIKTLKKLPKDYDADIMRVCLTILYNPQYYKDVIVY